MSDTAQVAHVIRSAEEFLAALKVGDKFWYMSSHQFRPHAVKGPFRVIGLVRVGKQQFLNVKCGIRSGRVEKVECYSVNDLTNEYHGVFTDEAEARAYFMKKQTAFDAEQRAKAPKKP